MIKLNFPTYNFNIKEINNNVQIFARVRKKFVALTPEEWVRQHVIWYIIEELNYPEGLIKIEHSLVVNKNKLRCDVVVFSNEIKPLLIIECKAPTVNIDNKTMQQIGRYNIITKTKYLYVTNGIKNICCSVDFLTQKITFINKVPDYIQLTQQ